MAGNQLVDIGNKIMWWGYLHSNGSQQLSRWSGDKADYTADCEGNDFVVRVVSPFEARTREDALMILNNKLSGVGTAPEPKPIYLGDSVYAVMGVYAVTLTTRNGLPTDPSNTIVLETDTLKTLIKYAKAAGLLATGD